MSILTFISRRLGLVLFTTLLAACASAPLAPPAAPVGHFIDLSSGAHLYYEIRGSGRPLVMLHGGGSSIETTFGKIIPYFADRQLILIEQQGHGHSPDFERDFSFSEMADDTNELLDSIGIDSADVFGFSNGASVALELAIRHPARVQKMVLGSTFFRVDGITPEARAMFKLPPSIDRMPQVLKDEYRRIAPNPGDLPVLVKKEMKMLTHLKNIPLKDMKGILSPALILIGEHDIIQPRHAAEMAKLIRGSRYVVLPGGHGSYLGQADAPVVGVDMPKTTAAMIAEFLATP